MATQRTSTTVKKVIRVTREEIETILRDKYGCKGEVEWEQTSLGTIEYAELYGETETESKLKNI